MQKEQTRNDRLEIRLEPGEKQAFQTAADTSGLPLSSWVRERLRKAARRELEDANQPVDLFRRP